MPGGERLAISTDLIGRGQRRLTEPVQRFLRLFLNVNN